MTEVPTLLPTLTVNGPFTVDEGSVGTLSAAAKQPATKAWMQLFRRAGTTAAMSSSTTTTTSSTTTTNSGLFEGPFGYYQPVTQSWKYFAPLFCNALAVADDVSDQSDVPYLRTLAGFWRSASAIPTSR